MKDLIVALSGHCNEPDCLLCEHSSRQSLVHHTRLEHAYMGRSLASR